MEERKIGVFGLLKRTFMNTLFQMKLGEGNFFKRIDRVVDDAKIEMKGGIKDVSKEEGNKES